MSTTETTGLTITELRAVARTVLADHAAWEPLVHATPERRYNELLHADEEKSVWVVSWPDGHDTGYHDHDISAGAVAIVQGGLRDERLRVGGGPETRVYAEGEVITFDVSEIHRVRNVAGAPTVTINVYSPPVKRSGAYLFDPSGSLRRQPLVSEDDVRPLPVYGTLART